MVKEEKAQIGREFWRNKRVVVTGGSGFLGSYVCSDLENSGCRSIIVPRSKDYDLTKGRDVEKLYRDYPNPDIIIHLAAKVGGIGANKEKPGEFFYDNLMMGVQLMEQARLNQVRKFVY